MGEPSTSTSASASASAAAAAPEPDALDHRHPHEHRHCTPRSQLISIRIASGEDPEYVVNLDERRPVIVAAMRDVEVVRHQTALRCMLDRTVTAAAAEGTLGEDTMDASDALHCAMALTVVEHLRQQPEILTEDGPDSVFVLSSEDDDGALDDFDMLDGEIDELDALEAEFNERYFEAEALEVELDALDSELDALEAELDEPDFEPDAPEFEPDEPEFEPDEPEFEPDEPEFEPDEPEFEPDEPEFEPDEPEFEHDEPEFDFDEPEFEFDLIEYQPVSVPQLPSELHSQIILIPAARMMLF